MRYPALVAAIQQQRTLRMAHLVRLDFASQTMWVWDGVGPLRTIDGQVWQGIGQLGQISDVDRALVSAAAPTLTLSGVDPGLIAKTLAASAETKGRPARIFEQYFDNDTLQPIDGPLVLYAGVMDRMTVTASGPGTRSITVSLVTLLYNRRRPAFAYLSDRSQQKLHPGDLGCSQIPQLVQADPKWPTY